MNARDVLYMMMDERENKSVSLDHPKGDITDEEQGGIRKRGAWIHAIQLCHGLTFNVLADFFVLPFPNDGEAISHGSREGAAVIEGENDIDPSTAPKDSEAESGTGYRFEAVELPYEPKPPNESSGRRELNAG